jgi:hypothetical protein
VVCCSCAWPWPLELWRHEWHCKQHHHVTFHHWSLMPWRHGRARDCMPLVSEPRCGTEGCRRQHLSLRNVPSPLHLLHPHCRNHYTTWQRRREHVAKQHLLHRTTPCARVRTSLLCVLLSQRRKQTTQGRRRHRTHIARCCGMDGTRTATMLLFLLTFSRATHHPWVN